MVINLLIVLAVICVLGLVFLNILRLLSIGAKDEHFIGLFAKRNQVFLVLLFVVGLFRLKIWADALPQDGLTVLEKALRVLAIPGAAGLTLGESLTLGGLLDVVLIACAVFVCIKTVMILIFDFALKHGRDVDVPGIIRALIRWCAYLVAVMLILHFVLRWDVSSLLAGSAILSLVLGFALQDTLSNLFMGLSIHFEKSIQIGHWIRVGEFEGQVVGVSWRAINIRTFSGDYVIIPNSTFGKMEVTNYSLPTVLHAINVYVGASYDDPPNKVHKALLEAVSRTANVMPHPAPEIFTEKYEDFALTYRVKCWIRDYGHYTNISEAVRSNIWYVFKRHGITIPFPIRTVYMHQVKETTQEEERARCVDMLKQVDFLSSLGVQDFNALADGMRATIYAAGEEVVREGEEGSEFFMVLDGELEVTKAAEDKRPVVVGTLRNGAFFGEMSLLTGDKRSATVTALKDTRLVVIGREPFEKILRGKLAIVEKMSVTLAERIAKSAAALGKYHEEAEKARAGAAAETTRVAARILSNIRNFLRL
jgi:small-conductance mechanosensitive channel/CRP-like cAMP-binding protein